MSQVGIRQLRNNLSKYLNQVRDGDRVTITDRGQAIAMIVRVDGLRPLDQLIEAGLVTPAREKKLSPPERRVVPTEPVSPLVADQRR